jgi:hypothetical protein
MDTPALVKIDEVVLSYINEKNEDHDNYMRYKQIIIEGLTQELGVSHNEGVRVLYAEVDDVNTVRLPSDFINYTRIGIVANGQVYTLTQNDNITIPAGMVCGVEEVNKDLLKRLRLPVSLNYAKGGGYNIGEYRLDLKDRVIRFRGNLKGEVIVVEYRSSGVSLDAETYIPIMLVPVLKEYLEYTLMKRNLDIPENKVYRYMMQYMAAKKQYIKRKNRFNIYDIMDAINRGKSQGVK